MKPLLLLALLLTGCTVTEYPDGRKVEEVDKAVLGFVGDAARHQLRMPAREIERSSK